jgi:hypothetical protein
LAIQWSGLGPELLLRLDRGSGQPLRSQLEAGLREAIRSGRLNGGERLPSSWELARKLGVSPDNLDELPGSAAAGWHGAAVVPVAFGCVDRRV